MSVHALSGRVALAGWKRPSSGQRGSQHFGGASGRGTTSGRGRSQSGGNARMPGAVVQDISCTVATLQTHQARADTSANPQPATLDSITEDGLGQLGAERCAGAQHALMLAVSRRGGEVDLLAWPLPPDASPKSGDDQSKRFKDEAAASCADGAGASGQSAHGRSGSGAAPMCGSSADAVASALDAFAAPPMWLRSLPLAEAGSAVSQSDRQNLWTPVCWLPDTTATTSADTQLQHLHAEGGANELMLLTGGHAGAVLAWRIQPTAALAAQLSSYATPPAATAAVSAADSPQRSQQDQPSNASDSHSSPVRGDRSAGSWRRSVASRAEAADSWRGGANAAPLSVSACRVDAPCSHTRMLFSMHVASCADSSDDAAAGSCTELWSTSLDRQVIVCRIHGSCDVGRKGSAADVDRSSGTPSLRLEQVQAWACTGAPVTALSATQVRSFFTMVALCLHSHAVEMSVPLVMA